MIELAQDDFTVKVSGSTTLLELDTELARYGQTSTLTGPANHSISQILLENWGFNSHQAVLGLSVEHQGVTTKCGGQVIKNVSGYDLTKLYIGSCGDYGSISSAYLRTTKLAEQELIYSIPEALWSLDLSRWNNCSIVIASEAKQSPIRHPEPHTTRHPDSEPKAWLEGSPQHNTTIRLWGEADLLALRAAKLEKQIKDFKHEEIKYQKHYPSTKTKLEFNCSHQDLREIHEALAQLAAVKSYPLSQQIILETENPAAFIEKIPELKYKSSLIIYPRDRTLEQYYNQTKPAEERLLASLYANFNHR